MTRISERIAQAAKERAASAGTSAGPNDALDVDTLDADGLDPDVLESDSLDADGRGPDTSTSTGGIGGGSGRSATAVLERPRVSASSAVSERPARPTIGAPDTGVSRTGVVALVVSAGIFIDASAYALARTGHASPVLTLFFIGLLVIFAPCAWRLAAPGAGRRERLHVSLLLGVGLLVSDLLRSPRIFDGFDELIHGGTLNQLLYDHTLHVPNSVLPISPYFPGLELLTIAVKWVTGLPLLLSQDVVVLAARVLLVLGVFLVVEKVCGSARAGGLGVLVYAANPQFYSFDAQYDYETVALALAVGAVYLFIAATQQAQRWAAASDSDAARRLREYRRSSFRERSIIHPAYLRAFPTGVAAAGAELAPVAGPDPAESSRRVLARSFGLNFVLALVGVAALAVTHHLTSWLTVAFLVAVAIGLRNSGRSVAAGVVGSAAFCTAVVVGLWTAFVGVRLWTYLGPIFHGAWSGVTNAVAHLHATRQLFHSAAGVSGAPTWEIVVMLLAAAAWCVILVPSSVAAIRGRSVRGGALRWIAVVVAGAYPLTLVAHLSTTSAEVGVRATAFLFFGVAVVVGGWLALRLGAFARPRWRAALVGVSLVCFLGTMLLGSGPDWTLVPGNYMVTANQRSVGSPSLAVAEWARTHIARGTHVAADRINGALMAEFAGVQMVTAIGGMVNAGPLFFSTSVGSYDVSLIRKADIRYIVVDDRLSQGLPELGAYVEPGETGKPTRLTSEELHKFAGVPGIRLVYTNGPIQVYDLSGILGTPAPAAPVSPVPDRGAADVGVMAAAAAVGVLVLVRLRRLRGRRGDGGAVVRWMVVSILAGIVVGAAIVPTHASPTVVGLGALAAVAVVALVGTHRRTSDAADHAHGAPGAGRAAVPGRGRFGWGGAVVVALTGALLAGGVLLASLTARTDWRAPDQVTLSAGPSGQTLATVQLAAASRASRLVVAGPGGTEISEPLAATTGAQTVLLPAAVSPPSTARVVAS